MKLKALKGLLGIAALAMVCAAGAAPQVITAFDGTSMTTPVPNPAHARVAVDASGRIHVVWAARNTENASTRYNIFYKLFDSDGSVLIDATQVSSATDNANKTFKPQVAVAGTDQVFVAWHVGSGDGVRLIGLDPSQDDLSGDAATLATIERFAEKGITSADTGGLQTNHVYLDADSAGRAHVMVQEYGDDLYCGVYNDAGTAVKTMAQVSTKAHNWGTASVSVALDSNDKMHVANVSDGTNVNEAHYFMVDCLTGTVMIAPTIVSADDTTPSMHTSLAVIDDKVYINWVNTPDGDSSCGNGSSCNDGVNGGGSNILRFIALDPSLDDQDGSAATLGSIATVAAKDVETSAVTTASIWYPRMGADQNNNLSILFYASNGPGNLYSVTVNPAGNVVTAAQEVFDDGSTTDATSSTKADVSGRAVVYPEGQTIKLVLNDASASNDPALLLALLDDDDDDEFLGSGWPLVLLLLGLRRRRRR